MKNTIAVITAAVVFALILTGFACSAQPHYVIIKKHFKYYELRHVSAPPAKKLRKWYYDPTTDTYYRGKSLIGTGLQVLSK